MRPRLQRNGVGDSCHRWYETQTGRYSSPDPLGRKGDPHPFAYAMSRPTFLTDPLGLKVTNNANCLAFVKEENTGESHALPPGQTWDGPQDGFALPCCRPCEVFKTTNGVDAELGANCSVALSGGNGLVQSLLGGWKDRGWNSGRHDKNDHGWDDTFDDACSPPKPCLPETGPDPRVRQSP